MSINKPTSSKLPQVTIITINYNSSKHTIELIDSIRKFTEYIDFQIIIVDNSSKPDDYEQLLNLKNIENLKIIKSEINLGFAGGNMLAVQHIDTNPDYLLFINNDCILLNNLVGILTEFLERNGDTALSTAQMYNEDNSFHSSFGYFPSLSCIVFGSSFLRLFKPKNFIDYKSEYYEPQPIQRATGSLLFFRAKDFFDIGGFDTNYFLYCEEEDICKRIYDTGKKIYLVPEAKFIHKGGASTKKMLGLEKEYYISLFYYYKKHYGKLKSLILRFLLFVKFLRKSNKDKFYKELAFFILKGANQKESLRYELMN